MHKYRTFKTFPLKVEFNLKDWESLRRRGLSAKPAACCVQSDGVLVKHYRSCDVCALHVSRVVATDGKSLMGKAMSVRLALGALGFLKKDKKKIRALHHKETRVSVT